MAKVTNQKSNPNELRAKLPTAMTGLASNSYESNLRDLLANRLFQNGHKIGQGSEFHRPLRPQDSEFLNQGNIFSKNQFISSGSLLGQRLLNVIYEQDLVFLPHHERYESYIDFWEFYNPHFKAKAQIVKPILESQLFQFLDYEGEKDHAELGGMAHNQIDVHAMRDYMLTKIETDNSAPSIVCQTILKANDPARIALFFLIQMAGDFVTEASAMARNVLGNYGQPLSELFTILIDEYGYGIHQAKHSTIFEKLMKSAMLNPAPHHYWGYYLSTSLAMTNYFHYISANHGLFFRYIGAMFYAEATLHEASRKQATMLREIFGNQLDLTYFDEHAHIDKHHAVMALDRVIMPIIARCGEEVIPEILRGFDQFRLLQNLADGDFLQQLSFCDNLHKQDLKKRPKQLDHTKTRSFHEQPHEISQLHLHDDDEYFEVCEGELTFYASPFHHINLKAGEGILIPKARLHGTQIGPHSTHYQTSKVIKS